jgi:futalosine hydrolase
MKILVVAATSFEIEPLLQNHSKHQIDFLITGVGQMLTAYHTGIALAKGDYQFALNAGICGSFRRDWELGKVVNVISEQFGDLGIEEADATFKDMFEMRFLDENKAPFVNAMLLNPAQHLSFLTNAKSLTINKVHGAEPSIEAIKNKYHCDIESMEGIGFFYACLLQNIPFLEIRSISNYVEKRNRDQWNIPLAIQNLNQTIIEILEEIA